MNTIILLLFHVLTIMNLNALPSWSK